jgi:hypothetical protein
VTVPRCVVLANEKSREIDEEFRWETEVEQKREHADDSEVKQ